MRREWAAKTVSSDWRLEQELNAFSQQGWTVFSVNSVPKYPHGGSDFLVTCFRDVPDTKAEGAKP
jgi:hypothetical protein